VTNLSVATPRNNRWLARGMPYVWSQFVKRPVINRKAAVSSPVNIIPIQRRFTDLGNES
jgi:hypothetical protein